MDQTTELLSTLSEEEVAAYSTGATEPHIVIGFDRRITVPEQLKRIAVQFDHNVETVTFDCPRYWDGIDMSTADFVVYINYLLPDTTLGCYVVEGVTIDDADDQIMHFDWTISGNITQVKGNVTFLVAIKKVDEEGNDVHYWNSELSRDMYVSEGLQCVESISELYPDVITRVLVSLDRFEASDYSVFSARVEALESDNSSNKTNIANLTTRMSTAETDVKSLKTSTSTNTTDISSLDNRMSTAEGNISTIYSKVANLENNLDDTINPTTEIKVFCDGVDVCLDYSTSRIETAERRLYRVTTVKTGNQYRMFGLSRVGYLGGVDATYTTNIISEADISEVTYSIIDGDTASLHNLTGMWWCSEGYTYGDETVYAGRIAYGDSYTDSSGTNVLGGVRFYAILADNTEIELTMVGMRNKDVCFDMVGIIPQ